MKKNGLISRTGKMLFWCLCLSFLIVNMTSCTEDGEGEESKLFNYLQGKWVTTHIMEKEYFVPSYGGEPYSDYVDRDITSKNDEDYGVIGFDRKRMCTMYESGSTDGSMPELPISALFRLSGDKLSCPMFYGDFTTYVTVTMVSDDKMTLTLIDNGTDEEGKTEFTQVITFERYELASTEDDDDTGEVSSVYTYLQGQWETTHITAEADYIPLDGSDPYKDTIDKDITSDTDDNYMKIGFDGSTTFTIYESPELGSVFDLPYSEQFSMDGNKMLCTMFGDMIDTITMNTISMNEMELKLEGHGVLEGDSEYTITTTYRFQKVNE